MPQGSDNHTFVPLIEAVSHLRESLVITDAQLDQPGPLILYVNPAFTRMTGWTMAEIIGRTPRVLQGPETDRETIARLRRCLETGETFEGEAINYRKDGSTFVMRWYIRPIRDPDMRITHYFAIQRDATAEIEAHRQQRALELAIGQLDDGVVLFDRNGRVGYTNTAYLEWSGAAELPLIDMPVWRLPGAPGLRSELSWARQRLGLGKVWKREYAVRTRGADELRFVFVAVSPIRNAKGEIAEYLAIVRDVTEVRRLKSIAEAHNFHDHLGGIFSGIRHELGNPINSVKTALQVVAGSIDTMPKAKLHDYLDRMGEEIGRVEYLLRSLRNYNLYDQPQLESIDLPTFLDRFGRLARADGERSHVRVEVTVAKNADTVWADPQALHQVLVNLVGNAVVAFGNQADARVGLRAECRGKYCSLTVSDNGPGIPADHLRHVFKPFYTTRSGGTGLGLPICRHLLSLMRGSIELSSSSVGTEIRVLLDRQEPATNAQVMSDAW